MKKIGIKIVVLGTILAIFPAYSMTRWAGLKKIFPRWQKPISLVPTNQSNAFQAKKTFMQSVLEKYPSLTPISNTYQKIETQLQSLLVSPSFLSRMAFTFMTGIPIFVIDFTGWAASGKKLFAQIMGKKLSFNLVYQKNPLRLTQSNKDELMIRLEKLANLSSFEKQLKQHDYEEDVRIGKKSAEALLQAEAWLFGSTYRDAIPNAETIDDIALLYESASMWLRSRIESGLYDDVANLEIEYDRIDQQAEKIIAQYDEQSIPIAKQYLQDMRQDFKDRFSQWLDERQKIIVTG